MICYYYIAFRPPLFLMRTQLIILLEFKCKWWVVILLLLSGFSPCFWFQNLYCDMFVDLFAFILFEVYWTSRMCRLLFFNEFGKLSTSKSLNIFSAHFSFFSPCSPLIIFTLVYLIMLTFFRDFIFLHSFFSLFFRLHNLSHSKFTNYFFCQFKSTVEPLYWVFHFNYAILFHKFHLVVFCNISLLIFSI